MKCKFFIERFTEIKEIGSSGAYKVPIGECSLMKDSSEAMVMMNQILKDLIGSMASVQCPFRENGSWDKCPFYKYE